MGSGNDEISSRSRQFLFKVVKSAIDNFLIGGSEIFIDFNIKRCVRKLPQRFFLVEVGPLNNQSATFVGHNYVSALTKFF